MKRVIKLLEEGAPVNWKDNDEWTSLHVMCRRMQNLSVQHETNCLKVMKVLLRYKANVNQQDNSGDTPLHCACRHGLLAHVKILLATGQCDLG